MFRLAVESVSRRTGRSAPAAAAYRSGELILNNRTGRKHDFRRRRGVEEDGVFIMHPDGCEWANDRATLWNAAEVAENRKDAKVAREVIVALPWVLNRAQRRALCRRLGQFIVDRFGVAVDIALHEPSKHGDQRNWHAHLLLTTRLVGPAGLGAKTRQLDVSSTASIEIENLRATWEKFVNEALEQAGSADRVSHLSHARRGDGLLPQVTLGVAATAMERRGYPTEKGDRNREIAAFNSDTLAHQEAEVRFQALVKQVERRARAGRDSGSAGVIHTRNPVSPVRKSRRNFDSSVLAHSRQPAALIRNSRWLTENAVPVSPAGPSFSDRRAASDRRMASARLALRIVDLMPPPRSNAIAQALAELEMQAEASPEALVGSVRSAWGSDGPVQLRYDVAGDLAPVTRVLIRLRQLGLKIPPEERQGTQRICRVPTDDLVAAFARSSLDDREDFLQLLREAGLASRAEAARYDSQQAQAERTAVAAAVRAALRVRDPHLPVAGVFAWQAGPSRELVDDLQRIRPECFLGSALGPPSGPQLYTIRLKPLTELVLSPNTQAEAWITRLRRASDDDEEQFARRKASTAAPRRTVEEVPGHPAAKVYLPEKAATQPAAGARPPALGPGLPTPAIPPAPVDTQKPQGTSGEASARPTSATVLEQLAGEGGTFAQWAASWCRAVIDKNGPETSARRTAWELSFGAEKVASAIRIISMWAKTSAAEVTKWAFSEEKLPAAELAKLNRMRRIAAQKQKQPDGRGR